MKFISWNVNGLRACLDKGFMDIFKSFDADIFALQETKATDLERKIQSSSMSLTNHGPPKIS